ncbi:MAG TPA: hypothetical protein VES90_07815 [Candidatus Eisenbacteria bacterium]|nr:hypothetical protein [Candidatus Eisenbacteria bacterium]
MDTTTIVIVGLAVLVIVLMLLFSRGGRSRHLDLQPLSNESRDRYLTDWDRIEMRFVDAPEEAVREADAIVMSVLRERRHPLETRKLPADVQAARKDASMERGDRTEGMRRAMLRYRAVMEKMVPAPREERSRREMA